MKARFALTCAMAMLLVLGVVAASQAVASETFDPHKLHQPSQGSSIPVSPPTVQRAPATAPRSADIVVVDNVNRAVLNDVVGTSINWVTGETCDCDPEEGYDFNPFAAGEDLAFWWWSDTGEPADRAGVSLDGITYAVLQPGDTIGPDSTFLSTGFFDAAANWRQAENVDGYLGFRFDNEGTINYGYARLTTTGTTGFPATIVSYAYNEAGDPITIPFPDPRVQVAHLAPFASGVDSEVTIRLNGEDTLTNFAYGDSTAYISLPAMEYLIEVVLADDTPAASTTLTLSAGNDYTLVAIGDGDQQPVSLVALVDDNRAPAEDSFRLRLVHAAPFEEGPATADIRLTDGTLITRLDFGDVTGYTEFAAGEYDLLITAPGGDPVLIDILPVDLADGAILTVFATGDGSIQPLGAFALPANAEGFFLPLVSPEPTPGFFTGELTPDSQTFDNPDGEPGLQFYACQLFTVDTAGTYIIETASPNTTGTPSDALDTFLRLYVDSFDPDNPGERIVQTDGEFTGPLQVLPGPFAETIGPSATGSSGEQPASRLLDVDLQPGTEYFLVNTSFRQTGYEQSPDSTDGGATGPFFTGIAGPGSITLLGDCRGPAFVDLIFADRFEAADEADN